MSSPGSCFFYWALFLFFFFFWSYSNVFGFCFIILYIIIILTSLFVLKDRKEVDMDRRGGGEELGRVEVEKS